MNSKIVEAIKSSKSLKPLKQVIDQSENYLGWITPKLRTILYNSKISQNFSNFLYCIRKEYGIDTQKLDPSEVLTLYENNSQYNDSHTLLRLFNIYKHDYKKFKVEQDTKIYYLLKYLAYSQNLFDRKSNFSSHFMIDPQDEKELYDFIEKNPLTKLEDPEVAQNNTITNINIEIQLEKIREDDYLVEVYNYLGKIRYRVLKADDFFAKELIILAEREKSPHLEACRQLAYYYTLIAFDQNKATEYFNILEDNKYYQAFPIYSIFLSKLLNYKRSEEIFLKGVENGFFDIESYVNYLNTLDIMEEALESNIHRLCKLLELCFIGFFSGQMYYLQEFFFLYKLITEKFFKVDGEKLFKCNIYYEMYMSFQNLVFPPDNIGKLDKIKNIKDLSKSDYCEILTYYGKILSLGHVKEKDNTPSLDSCSKADVVLSLALEEKTITPFSKTLLHNLLCKNFKVKINLHAEYSKMGLYLNSKDSDIYKFDLYNREYFNFLNAYTMKISSKTDYSSFFYYKVAKMNYMALGVKRNVIKAVSCYKLAINPEFQKNHNISSLYYKLKSLKALDDPLLKKEVDTWIENKVEDKYGDNCCGVCYGNFPQNLFFPCLHYICCNDCVSILYKNNPKPKCPFCRHQILNTMKLN